jgi:hypothetical protein
MKRVALNGGTVLTQRTVLCYTYRSASLMTPKAD